MSQQLISLRFPYLPVRLEVGHETFGEEALLDTGFDGGMAVPPSLLSGREPDWHRLWQLADGSQVPAPVYQGIVRLGDFQPIPVHVVGLGDEYIIGVGILNRFAITFDHGERVVVDL
jgi:predicted aspartyl protease